MGDLSDLYQQIIVEHNRSPRNFKKLPHPTNAADGSNPLCGDQIRVELQLDGDRIADIGFQGSGCAISQASASLLTGAVLGKSRAEAEKLFQDVHAMLTAAPDAPVDAAQLGKLAALAGVRRFPVRVKCASLSWHTLRAALQEGAEPVTTE
ncbi:MAG TPA: SUF system NifU family Fe-S cluster assembly protein [Gemmatimonadales bacterium]|nr:SUF system NifU family Fe-S cluster assembly protein [Gemmatimonadales bacterium]